MFMFGEDDSWSLIRIIFVGLSYLGMEIQLEFSQIYSYIKYLIIYIETSLQTQI